MPRATLNQTSFTAGVLSPQAMGRTDLERYQQGLKDARNILITKLGGFKRRPGTWHVAEAATGDSILVPFIVGRTEAWMVEFRDEEVRIYTAAGALAATVPAAYSIGDVRELDWAQQGSDLWLFHPDYPIGRLQRFSDGSWSQSDAPFSTEPFAEQGLLIGTATLSAATVGTGRTLTWTSGDFKASDVGRIVMKGPGLAAITAFGSATSVTVTITRAFASTDATGAKLDASPQTSVTPTDAGPVGLITSLTAAADAWRANDVGKFVRMNGGLLRITGFSSGTVVNARILRELVGTTAAPALAWSLEASAWGGASARGPRTGTFHQQRLIVAGSSLFPRTVWGSRIGEPLDFELGTSDDLAFAWQIDGDESSPISYVSSGRDLMVLTESAEYSLRSGVEKALTPTNVRVVPESGHGTAAVRPTTASAELLMAQRAGRKIRSLGYRYDFDEYSSPDLTALADHITQSGIRCMAWAEEPYGILAVVRNDGKMAVATIDRDQQPAVVAWNLWETDGTFEWAASIPNGEQDQLWVIVRRTINGVTKRYIERFDDSWRQFHPTVDDPEQPADGVTLDCAIAVDNAAGQTTFTGLGHLEGEAVQVVADGIKLTGTVASSTLTLPRSSKRTLIGLPFSAWGKLLKPEFGTSDGSAQGKPQRTGKLVLRMYATIGGRVVGPAGNGESLPTRSFGPGILGGAPMPLTYERDVSLLGWERSDYSVEVRQDDPLPLHVLAAVRYHTSNP